ncbi:MAG: type I restriction enzyme HsdR N-terminal domain-containing protein [Flavobacteriaceae bacterium]|nr:type I restriction enzyme HsdR N-terminal domain-containing protein [Flavobacteriaceae bacterium]
MYKLNLPSYSFKVTKKGGKHYIYDEFRKKNIVLTPEEWVRQHYLQFLVQEKKYPKSLIAVEKELKINSRSLGNKRFDILVFNNKGKHEIIVECKSPKIKISQDTFDQIARYNLQLNATYLIVTNGLEHYYCKMNFEKQAYNFLKNIPNYAKTKL